MRRIFTALALRLLHADRKFLSRSGFAVQQLFQLIQRHLWRAFSGGTPESATMKKGKVINHSLSDMVA